MKMIMSLKRIEIVDADIVETSNTACKVEDIEISFDNETGELRMLLKSNMDINLIKVVDSTIGESWELAINQ